MGSSGIASGLHDIAQSIISLMGGPQIQPPPEPQTRAGRITRMMVPPVASAVAGAPLGHGVAGLIGRGTGAAGRIGGASVMGGLMDSAVIPEGPNVFNIVNEHAPNPVTRALGYNPDSHPLVNRLRTMAEGTTMAGSLGALGEVARHTVHRPPIRHTREAVVDFLSEEAEANASPIAKVPEFLRELIESDARMIGHEIPRVRGYGEEHR